MGCVVKATPWPPYPRERETPYPLYRRLPNLLVIREITNKLGHSEYGLLCVYTVYVVFRLFGEKCYLHRTVDKTA